MFKGQKSHQDEAVRKAQEYIEKKLEQRVTVDALAGEAAAGRRSFNPKYALFSYYELKLLQNQSLRFS